jgi:hypothetical protein
VVVQTQVEPFDLVNERRTGCLGRSSFGRECALALTDEFLETARHVVQARVHLIV